MPNTSKISEKCYVHLNGRAIGHVADPLSFVKEVRASRRKGALSGEVNIAYLSKLNVIHINTDRGRVRKPYIIVEDGEVEAHEGPARQAAEEGDGLRLPAEERHPRVPRRRGGGERPRRAERGGHNRRDHPPRGRPDDDLRAHGQHRAVPGDQQPRQAPHVRELHQSRPRGCTQPTST